jgi:hypothetical protein
MFSISGNLSSFQNESDWKKIVDLINTIENNGENKTYWTGLTFQNNTSQYIFSDATNASFANRKNIAGNDGNCVAVVNRTNLERSNCSEEKYFICKIKSFGSKGSYYCITHILVTIAPIFVLKYGFESPTSYDDQGLPASCYLPQSTY